MVERIRRSKSFLSAAIVVPLVVLLGGCNWTMFGFDATHSGYNSAESVIGAGNVGTLVERGATAADDGPISSSPTVVNNTLYVTSDNAEGGTLAAYSAIGTTNCTTYSPPTPQSCTPLWTAQPSGAHGLNSTPAVDTAQGIVYVGSDEGVLYAYDANGSTNCVTTGSTKVCSPLWQSDLLGGSINSSPTLANGYVYVSTVYGAMYAFDETTGYDGNNPSCATTHAGRVCHWEWKDRTPGDVYSSPAVSNGLVFTAAAGSQGALYAFDADTDGSPNCSGTPYVNEICLPQWQATWDGGGSSPAVVNGVVYIGSALNGLMAFAADGPTDCSGTAYAGRICTPLWTGSTGRQAGSSPAVANGVAYIGSRNGTLYAFDATTGTQLWTASVGGSITSAPAVADGVVYAGCSTLNGNATCTNNLFAFDATSGAQLWTGPTAGGSIDSSPIVVDDEPNAAVGAVYVGAGNQVFGFTLP